MPELNTAHAFEWVQYTWGEALQCRSLADIAHHCFTTRRPVIPPDGASTGVDPATDVGRPTKVDPATGVAPATVVAPDGGGWQRVAQAFGVPRSRLVRLRQIHGASVLTLRSPDAQQPVYGEWAAADASVTDSPHVALIVKTADCIPLLLGDRRTGAVAAVHAGWRGAMSGVVASAVRELGSAFSARPADLVAAIGPSIGSCCYRVGSTLRDQFLAAGQPAESVDHWFASSPPAVARRGVPGTEPVSAAGNRPLWLNMWRVVSDQLASAGLSEANIHVAGLCTSCQRDVFHSYRVDGPAAGRMVAVIRARITNP